jgi:hypothetical protein
LLDRPTLVARSLPADEEDQDEEDQDEEAVPAGLLVLIGSVNGPEDPAEEHDDHIRERMRERFGDSA